MVLTINARLHPTLVVETGRTSRRAMTSCGARSQMADRRFQNPTASYAPDTKQEHPLDATIRICYYLMGNVMAMSLITEWVPRGDSGQE